LTKGPLIQESLKLEYLMLTT